MTGAGDGDEKGVAPTAAAAAAAEREALLKSAERKLSKRILPCLSLLSIICYLDRANLAFASSAMNADLGFSTATYGLGSGLFFIGYALFQVPSNMVMARVGGPLWLSSICIAWGTVAACFAAINSEGSFLALRMLLGLAESGALPGMWLYTSQFYLPHRLTIPMTLVMAGITIAQVLGAPLATGFLAMNGAGGLAGWRWLFLLEGIPSILLGLNLWWLLPGSIARARFLSPEERQALQEEMAKHQPQLHLDHQPSGTGKGGSSVAEGEGEQQLRGCWARCYTPQPAQRRSLADDWAAMKVALRCPIVYCSGVWRCLYAMAVYGLQYFTPLIIQTMLGPGASTTEVTLLSAIPFGAAAIFHICNALHSQYTGERHWHIALPWLFGGIFMSVLPTVTGSGKHAAAMAILTIASVGVNGADGPDVAWITSLQTAEERLLGLPTINMVANVGGFVGPYIIGALNTASGNYNAAEWVMGGCILMASLMVMVFPLRWASVQPQQAQEAQADLAAAEEGAVQDGKLPGALSSSASRLWTAAMCMTHGDAVLLCPDAIRSQVLPELEPPAYQAPAYLRGRSLGSALRHRVLAGGDSRKAQMQRAATTSF